MPNTQEEAVVPETNEIRMRPILIIPPDCVSTEDQARLNENWICVVVAKDPAAVKFLDPIPHAANHTHIEAAAIALSRKVLTRDFFDRYGSAGSANRSDVSRLFVELLVKGTALDPAPSRAEVERDIFDEAKAEEIRKLAREEARAERQAAKAAKQEAAAKAGKTK